MNITVIGTGYVGLVTGVMLSDFDNNVTCVDNNEHKIELLNNNICPIYEPGIEEVLLKCKRRNKLSFTTDIEHAIQSADVIFIAVGTPSDSEGNADLSYVTAVTKKIGECLNGYKVIVNKSTVPVGTGQMTKSLIQKELDNRGLSHLTFDVVSNPEFLREGNAVFDFRHPDRIVLGTESPKALKIMRDVYKVLYLNHSPFVECDIETAEMIKYANNAFLATKISFINEIANVCEKVGANVQKVAECLGKDGRISPKFLHAGPGFGGSCFPKDTKALIHIARQCDERVHVVEAVVRANEAQKMKMVEKISVGMNGVKGKKIAILGITFKPETDDMRDAPSLVIVRELIKLGAHICIYDPEGQKEGKTYFSDLIEHIEFGNDPYDAAESADAVVILTEWNQFRNLDFKLLKEKMNGIDFFDLRNIYSKEPLLQSGFNYYGVGV